MVSTSTHWTFRSLLVYCCRYIQLTHCRYIQFDVGTSSSMSVHPVRCRYIQFTFSAFISLSVHSFNCWCINFTVCTFSSLSVYSAHFRYIQFTDGTQHSGSITRGCGGGGYYPVRYITRRSRILPRLHTQVISSILPNLVAG